MANRDAAPWRALGSPALAPQSARVDEPGVEISPQIAVRAWELAYRVYGEALAAWERSPGDDRLGAAMASASYAVAAGWRRIAGVSRGPWWALAAVDAAALRFDAQARDWEAEHPAAVARLIESGEWGGRSW